jgi:methionyl-tRNA formyltransferase
VPASPLSLIFLGSKPIGYQCLEFLIASQQELNFRITGILTQGRKEFDNPGDLGTLAETNNIPILKDLTELPDCDILYSVQYHEILKQEHISNARRIAVNLHMAPLPEYRGCNQFSCAIIDDKKEFGTTIHQMDPRIDHGDILFEKRFPIPENCWVDDLYHQTEIASLALFKESLNDLILGNYVPVPQKNFEAERGTSIHYRSEIKTLKHIDLAWPAVKIERHIRATSMPGFEPPYCMIGDQKVHFE